MASESSLAAAFGSLTKTVDEPTTEQGTVDTEVVIPENDKAPEFVAGQENKTTDTVETVTTETSTTDDGDVEDYGALIAKELGLEGEHKIETFDDFVNIAKQAISPLKEKVELYESSEVLKGLAAHIQAGGTPEDYFARPQETNHFQGELPAEDDTEYREKLIQYYWSEKGVPQEQIEVLIDNSKEKGTFTADSDNIFNNLKAQEASNNKAIREAAETERAEAIKQRQEFITGVEKGFKDGFTGITVDSATLEAARNASLPDKQGKFGIQSYTEKLTPADEAIINTFIVALTNKKPFSYTPTKAVISGGAKPIHQIIGKTQGDGGKKEDVKSLNDLNDFFKKRRN